MTDNLEPLLDCIVRDVPSPEATCDPSAPLQMLVTQVDYDDHKGRVAIGRVTGGSLVKGGTVGVTQPGQAVRKTRITDLVIFDSFNKISAAEVSAGDLCGVAGLGEVGIGDTIVCPDKPDPLASIEVEEPTVTMTFGVNTSPFQGTEGKFFTSSQISERLRRETERDLALRVEPGETADQFRVSGRGALHLGILIENMRREGFEFSVGPAEVITITGEGGKKLEPYEEAVVEVPEEHIGGVASLFGKRGGELVDMTPGSSGTTRAVYTISTRGMLGIKNQLLTATKGTAVLASRFTGHKPWAGDLGIREQGSLVAFATGQASAYALQTCQDRGVMFVKPGDKVYAGQVVGIHQRKGDLKLNVAKAKQLTNMRASGTDKGPTLNQAKEMGLDDALEYIAEDELVEVTPVSVRIRKAILK